MKHCRYHFDNLIVSLLFNQLLRLQLKVTDPFLEHKREQNRENYRNNDIQRRLQQLECNILTDNKTNQAPVIFRFQSP